MKRMLASSLVLAAAVFGAGAAHAGNVHWSIGINLPPIGTVISSAPPAYYAPAPVYYAPAPVYYAPPPVVYRPVVYRPARVVYRPVPGYYQQRWAPPGHRHRHHHRYGGDDD